MCPSNLRARLYVSSMPFRVFRNSTAAVFQTERALSLQASARLAACRARGGGTTRAVLGPHSASAKASPFLHEPSRASPSLRRKGVALQSYATRTPRGEAKRKRRAKPRPLVEPAEGESKLVLRLALLPPTGRAREPFLPSQRGRSVGLRRSLRTAERFPLLPQKGLRV